MLTNRTSTVLAALAVATSFPAVARARQPNPVVHHAYRAAVTYLHGAPCDGHVSIRVEARPKIVVDSEQEYVKRDRGSTELSWAEWVGVEETANNPLGNPHAFTHCVVGLNNEYWSSTRTDAEFYPLLCTAMIHELGNLDGLPETEEATGAGTYNVRDAYLTEIITPPICYRSL